MKIVIKRVNSKPEIKEIEGSLHEMQELVGGHIECLRITDEIICVLNEEGRIKKLPINFMFGKHVIFGDVFFCSEDFEDFCGLTDEQAKLIMSVFS